MAVRQKVWNEWEAAILLEGFLETLNGDVPRLKIVKRVSQDLRNMAINQGNEIDDRYRNENGISFQMQRMESAYLGSTISKLPATKLFADTVEIYRTNYEEFGKLLEEAKQMINSETSLETSFMTYLASKVSPAQLSELYWCYPEIEKFCIRVKVLKAPLFKTTDISTIKNVRKTVEENKVFKMQHKREHAKMITAARHYHNFLNEAMPKTAVYESPIQEKRVIQSSNVKEKLPTTTPSGDPSPKQELPLSDEQRLQNTLKGISSKNKFGTTLYYLASQAHVEQTAAQRILQTAKWVRVEYGRYHYVDIPQKPHTEKAEIPSANKIEESKGANTQTILTVDLNGAIDLAFTKPVSFSYFGDEYSDCASWTALYVELVAVLYDDYPQNFYSGMAFTKQGGRIELIDAEKAHIMAAPQKVHGTNFALETNISASDIMRKIIYLLDLCGIDYENVVISYRKTGAKPTMQQAQVATHSRSTLTSDKQQAFSAYLTEGQNLAASTAYNYVMAVSRCETFARNQGYSNWELYAGDVQNILDTIQHLLADSAFLEQNRRSHNQLSAALGKYMDYCGGLNNKAGTNTNPAAKDVDSGVIISADEARKLTEVLRLNFEDGFRPEKAIDRNRFRMYFSDMYSEDVSSDDDMLIKQLTHVGTLRDNRIFVKDESTQRDLIGEINDFIVSTFESGASCIYTECLFNKYQEALSEILHIYNVESLEQVLFSTKGRKFAKKYSYLYCFVRQPDAQKDVLQYMMNAHTPVTYTELAHDLWYIPLDKVKHFLVTSSEIVNVASESYLYAYNLPVGKTELNTIRGAIHAVLMQRNYISGTELMQLLEEQCPSLLINTSEYPAWGLRNALSVILRDDFSFRGAIISRKNDEISMAEVFSDYCKQSDRITTAELKDFAAELNTVVYWDAVYSEMVRISADEFIRKDQVNFAIERIDELLESLISSEYVPLKNVDLFLHFPAMNIRWNSFLLESYIWSYSHKFRLLHTSFTATDCCGAIVRSSSDISDYRTLIIDVLSKESSWKTSKDALQLLVDYGYQQRRSYGDIGTVIIEAKAKANVSKN